MITHTLCASFLLELLKGTHDFVNDTFKLALYEDTASLGPDTTAYTATGECSGTGYTAGGFTLAVASGFPKLNEVADGGTPGRIALLDFDNISPTVTINARAALLYNSTKSNKAILVRDFGRTVSKTAETLTITWPQPDVSKAIIKLGGIVE